jgi:hypothetical protein
VVLPEAHVHGEGLVVVVLRVQVGAGHFTNRRQIGVERLEGERDPNFRSRVHHVAAAEAKVQAGAVDVLVGVLRDDRRQPVDGSDAARVDVAADAVVESRPDIYAPPGFRLGRLRVGARSRPNAE